MSSKNIPAVRVSRPTTSVSHSRYERSNHPSKTVHHINPDAPPRSATTKKHHCYSKSFKDLSTVVSKTNIKSRLEKKRPATKFEGKHFFNKKEGNPKSTRKDTNYSPFKKFIERMKHEKVKDAPTLIHSLTTTHYKRYFSSKMSYLNRKSEAHHQPFYQLAGRNSFFYFNRNCS
jgi:hypothetical protein